MLLRQIPKVDVLLGADELAPVLAGHPRQAVVEELRAALDALRRAVRAGDVGEDDLVAETLAGRLASDVADRLAQRFRPSYRRVLNATGVILHTGLGRAPLPEAAVDALAAVSGGAQRVEIDLATGERGGRDAGCARLLRELTGAEAAAVVNNNAAATLVALAALARGKKVILSRGEMVEIGGSYRIPEILRESGAHLVEVGTTNRTHERDYRQALEEAGIGDGNGEPSPDVGLILKVHPSNYRVVGFTGEVGIEALAAMGREHGVPVMHDLGSGCLIDLAVRGLTAGTVGETTVQASLEAGADIVCFSGDKLLGGPQAGLILGREDLVERCRRHPLFRTIRPGRLIYTALEATLQIYAGGEEEAVARIPALARLFTPEKVLRGRARRLERRLRRLDGVETSVIPCESQAGSGSLPARDLPSWAVRLLPTAASAAPNVSGVDDLARQLREGEPAILARMREGALLFDVRTLEDDALRRVAKRLEEIFKV